MTFRGGQRDAPRNTIPKTVSRRSAGPFTALVSYATVPDRRKSGRKRAEPKTMIARRRSQKFARPSQPKRSKTIAEEISAPAIRTTVCAAYINDTPAPAISAMTVMMIAGSLDIGHTTNDSRGGQRDAPRNTISKTNFPRDEPPTALAGYSTARSAEAGLMLTFAHETHIAASMRSIATSMNRCPGFDALTAE